jgi:putative DNA methylase
MVWDFAEANAFHQSVGVLGSINSVVHSLGKSPDEAVHGGASQADATVRQYTGKAMVCTDPPYYDNIGYADLSDFFYVWLRRSLATIHPELMATLLTPKSSELIATPYRHGGNKLAADDYFEKGLEKSFRSMCETQDSDFPLTLFYAFKQSEEDESPERSKGSGAVVSTGWETMLEGLINAGFSIEATWPMRTERTTRSVSIGTNALASSILLACRRHSVEAPAATRNDFIRALRREFPNALRQLQHGNIAPVDLAQAAIGPGMAIYTRFREVREPSGDRLTVRTALALINQILDEILAEQEGDYDSYTRMAIALFETHGMSEAPYGDAETLATAKGTSVAALVDAGILRSGRGRVALLARNTLPEDWDPARDTRLTVWEITQHLIRALDTGGQDAAARLLRAVGPPADAARDLAYRLYTVCERKGWTTDAQAYNSLVVAWPEISRLAAEAPAVSATQMQGQLI